MTISKVLSRSNDEEHNTKADEINHTCDGIDRVGSALLVDCVPSNTLGPILDLGSGEGQIGLSLAQRLDCPAVLVEIDPTRASIAKRLATALNIKGRVLCTDYFKSLDLREQPFGCIVSNPPQLPTKGECWSIADCAGFDGLDHIRRIADVASTVSAPGTPLCFHLLGFLPIENRNGHVGIEQILNRKGFNNICILAKEWFPLRPDGATIRELEHIFKLYGRRAFRQRHSFARPNQKITKSTELEMMRRVLAATRST